MDAANQLEDAQTAQTAISAPSGECEQKKKQKGTKREPKKKQKKAVFKAWKDFWIDLGEFQGVEMDHGPKPRVGDSRQSTEGSNMSENNQKRLSALPDTDVEDNKVSKENKLEDEEDDEEEAQHLWKIGVSLGVNGRGNDSEVITKMVEMERRDKEQRRKSRGAVNNHQ
ncbi:hypothetical protein RIF29_21892 [Crotalaria pallida]|uniref:Uncharacterized protein n=1 Tax=Crotalaria pallida TaxID=3830 RepID=A0AAN9F7Q9_CROPI